MQCPLCGGKAIGKIGSEQYYCWDCCVEYHLTKEGIHVYDLDEDGVLTSLEPMRETEE